LDKKIRVFLTIAGEGSFSAAARKLSLSQSVISFHIDALEKEFGVSLFNRHGRSISLTPDGEFLYKEARKLAQSATVLEDRFSAHSEKIAQRISLAGDALTCAFTLPWTLAAFKAENPDVEYSYAHLDQNQLIDKLQNNEIDLALVGHLIHHRKLQTRECFSDEIVLVTKRENAKHKIDACALKDIPILWMKNDRGLEQAITHELSKVGIMPKNLNIFMEIEDLTIAKNFAISGVAHVFLPRVTVANELEFGLLSEVNVSGVNLRRMTYLISRKGKQIRDIVHEFLAFVEERFFGRSYDEIKNSVGR